jgi:hypothetical protein
MQSLMPTGFGESGDEFVLRHEQDTAEMGKSGTSIKSIACPAGAWTRILFSIGAGSAKDWKVSFNSANGPVAGEVLEMKAAWIFPRKPKASPLQPAMTFQRDWINGLYWVKVKPTADLSAAISN